MIEVSCENGKYIFRCDDKGKVTCDRFGEPWVEFEKALIVLLYKCEQLQVRMGTMKITKVMVSKGRTVNLGNYESIKYTVGLEADVDEEDDVQKVKGELDKYVDGWDDEEFKYWQKQKNGK